MVRMARAAIAGWGLLALAACSGSGETAAPSTTAAPPPTTVAPGTTSAPTTTLSPQDQDEADIRALHDRFFRMIVVTGNPPNPDHPEIAATTTGIQRQRSEEARTRLDQLEQHLEGTFDHRVEDVVLADPNRGSVRVCGVDLGRVVSSNGSIVSSGAGQPTISETLVVRTADGWRVEDWFTGGSERCVR